MFENEAKMTRTKGLPLKALGGGGFERKGEPSLVECVWNGSSGGQRRLRIQGKRRRGNFCGLETLLLFHPFSSCQSCSVEIKSLLLLQKQDDQNY